MIDFLRPFLFPLAVCTIVGCVWVMAWDRSIEDRAARDNRATVSSRYVADSSEDAPEHTPASHGCQATASVDDE
jgi:hypothetical protein